MNQNTIEEKDKRLVKKIRTIVAQKEVQSPVKRTTWKGPGVLLVLVCMVLIGVGLTFIKKEPATAITDMASLPPSSKTTADKAVAVSEPAEPAEPQAVPDTVAETAPVEKTIPAEEVPVTPEETTGRNQPALAQATLETPETPAAGKHNVESPPAESPFPQTAPGESPAAVQSPSGTSDVQITHLTICGSVQQKQFANEKSSFSMARDGKAYVWMRVISKNPPFTLTHVYSVNGNHYCSVPLTIRYPHMRTWSKITLDHHWQAGKWHVDVVDEGGEVLARADFTVVP